ncbi:AraC family transcriptional regulator [Wenzhouxiangella marina]|uniref:AraC family transcriptional regulator n=1 Tax=Wenzhouxiangella marina TaxID=1579979 RepID=A0A0K0XXZ8_9GAMM|nr:AraC family transcriptional regulator [Wenzhouxiangella marina]AKS42550.1 AraC family transcriptional regulator [Wenzhouxiangella marina]MBB6085670.1 AraC-like DNA-binding protein [Wenzhouxiangella marina]
MGQITSLFVYKVIDQAHHGQDKRELLESIGIDPDAPVDPRMMVADTDYYAFFERVARSHPSGTQLPLRTGASMRCADYGAFGLAWKSALTLRGSFSRAERYARVLSSVSTYQVREKDEGVYMELHRDGDRSNAGLRLSNEATMASIVAISEEVSSGTFQAEAVFFKHDAPKTPRVHEDHFGCAVHFGADRDALLVSRQMLETPNKLGDPGIVKFFDTHLDKELSRFEAGPSFERRVRNQIAQLLSQGTPRVSEVASCLAISGRTLQRRLSERGYSFTTLVDNSRRELAERLLRDTAYPLAEVAFLTGFSEQSAFTRAFKRWAGQTPRSYRLAVHAAADD